MGNQLNMTSSKSILIHVSDLSGQKPSRLKVGMRYKIFLDVVKDESNGCIKANLRGFERVLSTLLKEKFMSQ